MEPTPESLRALMVEQLLAAGHACSGAVEEALRAVPRHRFVPAAGLVEAYADTAVITKVSADGAALSCASVPEVVAMMLDQLDVRAGHRVLEIGAGTGYNAALLARLTGPHGQVTTVDIDADVTSRAARALVATGNEKARVITRDGALGASEHAPYDRIIFTVGAWDVPPAIWPQLAPAGRLVLPLRWRGQSRSVAFVRDGDLLRSDSVQLCGFVPMVGQTGELAAAIDPDGLVTLHWDPDQTVDVRGVLDRPRTAVWSGVTVGPHDPFDGIWLRMTAAEPAVCRITAQPAAVEGEVCTPVIPSRSPALVEGDSLAYLARRPGVSPVELGAIGHGPAGRQLADRICHQMRAWNDDRAAIPSITLVRGNASAAGIVKETSRLLVEF